MILILVLMWPGLATANISCKGRFVNPITDICWSCLLPISIGGFSIGKGNLPRKRDTKNPKNPFCLCHKAEKEVPGVAVGFWEPVRLIEVTRTPYCMVNLGGIALGKNFKKISSYRKRGGDSSRSFYHTHYYIYPLIYWLELLTDFSCLEKNTFDVAYMSEFDITWNDPKLQSLLNPEAILFGNPLAQASCALDCGAASFNLPLDAMFWCAGCLGNMYPLSGANADHVGGVQNSSLLAMRLLNKLHRVGFAKKTSSSDSSIHGEICRKSYSLRLIKSQYKLQLTYPRTSSKGLGCWPVGLTDMAYSPGNEYPYEGEDWGYLVWRKKNCCLF
ncbi:MAG: conjugal transfer pilus assembly protein TraU [Gammaproteobacteria bacterium]|nr:conjugal transfer pilus assembly protein TraU [Gammaproteobacteria bacterium]